MSERGRSKIGLDTIVILFLGLVSLELNLPFSLDQLHFHKSMEFMGPFSKLFCPGGLENPLVLMGNQFKPYLLMTRTFTLLILGIYLLNDLRIVKKNIRTICLGLLILSHVIIPQAMMIAARVTPENHALAHDGGTIQMEESMRMLLNGKNPYTHSFHGTPLENWRGFTNNVVHHVPYMPGSFLYTIPFFGLTQILGVPYDQRMVYMILFLVSFPLISLICPAGYGRRLAFAVFGLNPFFVRYFQLGANDIMIWFLLLLTLVFFNKNMKTAGFTALAAACAVKQFAWFFVPFLTINQLNLSGLKLTEFPVKIWQKRKNWIPGAVLFLVTVLPFLIWDPVSFYQDTFKYGSGGLPTSYPIQGFHGYGFGSVLLFLRFIPDGNVNFPFVIIQALTVIPLFVKFYNKSRSGIDLAESILFSSIILLVFMFFSRYLHGNFVGFIAFWPVLSFCMFRKEAKS